MQLFTLLKNTPLDFVEMKTSVLEFIFKNTVENREQKKISAIEGFNINDPEQQQKNK